MTLDQTRLDQLMSEVFESSSSSSLIEILECAIDLLKDLEHDETIEKFAIDLQIDLQHKK